MHLWKIYVLFPEGYDFNMRRCFLAELDIFYIARIEQENNIDDKFTEDVRTVIMSDFQSAFDKSFSGVSKVLIKKN